MSSVPLRLRLVGVVVALSAFALALSGLAATTALRGYLVEQVDNHVSATIGRLVDDQSAPSSTNGSTNGGTEDGSGAHRPDPLTDAYAEVLSGTTLLMSSPLRAGVSAPALPADLSSHRTPFTVPSENGRHEWRVQVASRDGLLVVVAMPLDGVEATMGRLVLLEVGGGAAVLVLLAGIGYIVVRRSLRPLVQVEATAERIAAGDLTQRVIEGHPRTEVGSLSRSFNSMLAQIETAFSARTVSEAQARASEERMRRFVADASHELRTPLTSIRGFAELYRQGALPERDDVDRAMSRVESEALRMGGLVDDLLLLARLDQQRPIERARVDVVAVAANVVQDAQAAAPERTIRMLADDLEGSSVLGDAGRLAQVLSNLLTNAVAHTPASAVVTLTVRSQEEHLVIEVADNGPGISDPDKEQIFQRFYRADASRTRASGGNGLGLSIVAGIVHAHGGTVEVEDTPGGGATFRVELPLATTTSESISVENTPS